MQLLSKHKLILVGGGLFFIGLAIGGLIFTKSLPRSFLAVKDCEKCYRLNQIGGLLTSLSIQNLDTLPLVVKESDTCIAIQHPRPEAPLHYVFFPKKDIRDVASITPEDTPYVMGCLAMLGEYVRSEKLDRYRMRTNGPWYQHVTYLHFHLIARPPNS